MPIAKSIRYPIDEHAGQIKEILQLGVATVKEVVNGINYAEPI